MCGSQFAMTSVVVHSEVLSSIHEILRESKLEMLTEIASEFKLDIEYLERKFLSKHLPANCVPITKPPYNKGVSTSRRCIATTRGGHQCIKSRVEGRVYCQIHLRWKR